MPNRHIHKQQPGFEPGAFTPSLTGTPFGEVGSAICPQCCLLFPNGNGTTDFSAHRGGLAGRIA